MESDYTQLIERTQSFVDLLDIKHDESDTADADRPHVERIDFDQLRELLSTLRDKLDGARKVEGEMHRVRRRLAARIEALRRGGKIIADDGRQSTDSLPAEDVSLDELIRMHEEETARLHHATASSDRSVRSNRKIYRDYGEFK
jgi:hypothetical protein